MSILAAHQPQYVPWLGFFDKLDQADLFVLLDDVQFKKNEWQNRNRIKGPSGPQWLTVPVRQKFPQSIAEVEIRESEPWRRKHLRALESNYGRASCFGSEMHTFSEALSRPWAHLAELNVDLIRRLADRLGITTEIRSSSELSVRSHPTWRLVDLCDALGAAVYLSGAGGDYLEQEAFEQAGIGLLFQHYEHPSYRQMHGEFVPFMSVIDLLMNCGDESLSIIRSGRLAPS